MDEYLELIAMSEIEIIRSEFLRSGYYYLMVHAPIFGLDKDHPEVCTTYVVLKDSEDRIVLRAYGYGASEFQSLVYSFSSMHLKFLKKFDFSDQVRLHGLKQTMNLRTAIQELLCLNYEIVVQEGTKLGRRIGVEKIGAFQHLATKSEIDLSIAIHKPRRVRKQWHCAYQINNEVLVVKSYDSLRALTAALRSLELCFRKEFDDTWQFVYKDTNEEMVISSFEKILSTFFGVHSET